MLMLLIIFYCYTLYIKFKEIYCFICITFCILKGMTDGLGAALTYISQENARLYNIYSGKHTLF